MELITPNKKYTFINETNIFVLKASLKSCSMAEQDMMRKRRNP